MQRRIRLSRRFVLLLVISCAWSALGAAGFFLAAGNVVFGAIFAAAGPALLLFHKRFVKEREYSPVDLGLLAFTGVLIAAGIGSFLWIFPMATLVWLFLGVYLLLTVLTALQAWFEIRAQRAA
jgi:cation transport ATPase